MWTEIGCGAGERVSECHGRRVVKEARARTRAAGCYGADESEWHQGRLATQLAIPETTTHGCLCLPSSFKGPREDHPLRTR